MKNSERFKIEKFKDGKKLIVFFGSLHSKSIEQINSIDETISNLNPEIILIEGNYNKANFKSKEEAIKIGSETGYVSFLAKNKKINIDSNDPSFSEDLSFVEKNYDRDISFTYFFLRNTSANFPIEYVLEDIKKNSLWDNFEYSVENLKHLIINILNEEYNTNKDYSNYFNPTLNINKFNQITLELSKFRDEFMLRKINEMLIKYNRIFIIKGVYHLNKSKNEIRKLLEHVSK